MSDPAWMTRGIIDGYDSIVSVQVAGATAAPGTADELGFGAKLDWDAKTNVNEVGPHIHSATIKKSIASVSYSGTITVNIADGTDAVRELFFTALTAKSKVKLTIQLNPTTGPKDVFDQCIVGIKTSVDPSKGHTYDLTFDSDSYTHTAASA